MMPGALLRNTIFREVQRMRQWWLWLLLGLVVTGTGAILGWGLWQQLVLGRPWGNHPTSDAVLVTVAIAVALLHGAIVALLYVSRLETVVNPSELRIQFHPLHRKPRVFTPLQVASFEERIYQPIREYGGWGIRVGSRGWAYNVSGNRGVELTLPDGSRLMIGSIRPSELGKALEAAGFQRRNE